MKDYKPVYLLVVDDTPEFQVALHYTAHLAKKNGAHVALLHVMDQEDFQHWGTVAEKIHNEIVQEAKDLLLGAADVITQVSGCLPILYLQDGGQMDVILEIIKQDPTIEKFILGGSTTSSNAGPLVSYFTGKGLPELRVPLTIVPDTIDIGVLD